ncbi:MAG TPA: MurR/RpiR family transcriptional regulator [Bacillota bacterium]|nr:MurR/RpiR family transcriptional regulator [Bacillota bacterium]HOA14869.1 MurR/RpiR family transcriptional regulator [Bacillota bacterium]HOG52762.1 MurR/RpiR family transcriptional regulator [Bacillota bacterium]
MDQLQQRKGHLVRVESLLARLAPSEQKVAVAVLKDPSMVMDSGISDLAGKSGASEAAVVRFCKKAGYSGYKQFKMAMTQELGTYHLLGLENSIDEKIKSYGCIDEIINAVRDQEVSVLGSALSTIDREQLNMAADAIINCKRVTIFATGLSGMIANELNNRLMRLGFDTQFESSLYAQLLQASKLTPDDVAIGISYSGTTKEVVDAVGLAGKSGARTIAITNYPDMDLAKKSDIVIAAGIETTFTDVGMWSMPRIVGLAIIDIYMAAVAFKMQGGIGSEAEASRRALLTTLGIAI